MSTSPERLEGTVDKKLLEILVCPITNVDGGGKVGHGAPA